MSVQTLTTLIYIGGIAHFCILIASAMVPFQLNWKENLKSLSRLHRQMYWTYGGYVVLCIIAFGCISLTSAPELARRSTLARGFSLFVCIFWAVRLALQAVFDVKDHLTKWWLKLGYALLTILFAGLTLIYACAALMPLR